MYETLLRPHEVNQIATPLTVAEIGENLKKAEQRREEKRLKQIANSRLRNTAQEKRQRDDEIVGSFVESKRLKRESEGGDDVSLQDVGESLPAALAETPDLPPRKNKIVSKVMAEVRGHTSYLTFACHVPCSHGKGD
jgi:tRNA (adenine57-N1/adenine58-N1)-methyltransferase